MLIVIVKRKILSPQGEKKSNKAMVTRSYQMAGYGRWAERETGTGTKAKGEKAE
jgi:hypothetical protein